MTNGQILPRFFWGRRSISLARFSFNFFFALSSYLFCGFGGWCVLGFLVDTFIVCHSNIHFTCTYVCLCQCLSACAPCIHVQVGMGGGHRDRRASRFVFGFHLAMGLIINDIFVQPPFGVNHFFFLFFLHRFVSNFARSSFRHLFCVFLVLYRIHSSISSGHQTLMDPKFGSGAPRK